MLPTDAPHLSQQAAPLALAMSPVLWTQHRPDCFDTYSAGVVLLQMALPPLRTTTALRNFRTTLARAGHDLQEWRVSSALRARDTQLLDANDGEGWDLAAALLRPRKVQTDGEGNVKFVNSGAPRLGASAALRHPFVKRVRASWRQPAHKQFQLAFQLACVAAAAFCAAVASFLVPSCLGWPGCCCLC